MNGMLHQREYLLQPFEEADIKAKQQVLAEQQKQIDDAIVDLIIRHADRQDWDGDIEPFRVLIKKRRSFPHNTYLEHLKLPDHLEAYDDGIARRVLEKVTVIDGEHLMVTFRGGVTVEQTF